MSVIPEHLKYDIRIIRRELRFNRMDPKEVEKHLKSLPDSSGNASWIKPDGTPCTPDEEAKILEYHRREKLLYYREEGSVEDDSEQSE